METFKFTPEFLRQVRELALGWGKIAGKRAAEQLGSDQSLNFTTMEQLAAVVAAGVTEGTLAALVADQAQALTDHQPCPKCQTSCPVEYSDQSLTLGTGQVIALHEPICHCPKCRRDFFPPTDHVGAR